MIDLIKYIKEALERKDIQNLTVYYDMNHSDDIVLQAPDTMSEDDLTQYLGDRLLNDYPTSKEKAKKFFGQNYNKIIDAHFEYESFTKRKTDKNDEFNLTWDNEYTTKNYDKIDLVTCVFVNMKYVIQFESFGIKVENDTDIDENLKKIFEVTESNKTNEYPIDITLNEEKPFEYDDKI